MEDANIPIPQNFVVTGCYATKMRFAWSAVDGQHQLYKSFEYEILAEELQGSQKRTRRKITAECETTIENLVPGSEYTFYVRAVETSASLVSDLSEAIDIKIPDNKKIKIDLATPRAAKWKYINDEQDKIIFTWKSIK